MGPVVIEVNDNPNIDRGVEDTLLGEELYRTLMAEFERRLEARAQQRAAS
jgi:glutathione synthase/RimK-type ligase-like ATP-grasp enzyme